MPDQPDHGPKDRPSHRHAASNLAAAPVFVLVEPQMGENIGAVARAMLNFGVSGLRLVRPRDGWPNEKAGAMAAGASAVIDNAQVFDSLGAALADCSFVTATTARRRELDTPVTDPEAAMLTCRERMDEGQNCAVVFGGERNGLSSEDAAMADLLISIPVNPAFASLNLAQAACILSYAWSKTPDVVLASRTHERTPAQRVELEGLVSHLEQALDEAGYFFPPEKKPAMARNLRVALTQANFTKPEIHSLRGAIKALANQRRPQ